MKKLFRAAWKIAAWCVCRLFPVNSKKVVISSYYGRGYGDNLKYVADKLLASGKKLKIVWLVNSDSEKQSLPEGIKTSKVTSAAAIYHLSTAKVWMDNCRKGFVMFKRKKQMYIQTWHGFALKRLEKDACNSLSDKYIRDAKSDSRRIDHIISDSTFMTGIYKSAFWYDGDILEWGSPRNDIIINPSDELKNKVFEYFNLSEGKKIVLYAPTFRADLSNDAYSLDYKRLQKACAKRFDGDFAVLVRLHPNIIKNCDSMDFDTNNIVNASYYPDMQELLAVADIVVSDYSSLMFDFALSFKPCFQFATDIEDYKKDRNFYFDIEALPFNLSKSNDELENSILNFDEDKYKVKLGEFYDSVGMIKDGDSSEKCAELVLKTCCGDK